MPSKPNPFVWYDVMTTDTKAAEDFYRAVIGWEIKDSGMTDRYYAILSSGSAMVGGLMPIPDDAKGMPPAWTGYIGVDNVDDYAKRVKAAGGQILREPADIPTVGRFAVASDPHGAGFILFSGASDQAPTPAPAGTSGHIGWHELMAGDLDSAFGFYSGLFGWTKADAHDMGPMGIYQLFSAGGAPIGGMMTKPASMPTPHWNYYFNVESVDAGAERTKKAGGQIVNGPMEVPGGMWIAQGVDPQGASFAILSNKR
jgi:uncharacterized protein